jgi:hypothetical protein
MAGRMPTLQSDQWQVNGRQDAYPTVVYGDVYYR